MDGEALAEELVLRLAEVIPSRYIVEAQGGSVGLWPAHAPNAWCVCSVSEIVDQDGDPDYFLSAASYSVLDSVQDMIIEDTKAPWPSATATAPDVFVEDGWIFLWYGNRESPDGLELRPIQLRDRP